MKVLLVATARPMSHHKVQALVKVDELPGEGEAFMVKELHRTVIVDEVRDTETPEIHFSIPGEEVMRLREYHKWTRVAA